MWLTRKPSDEIWFPRKLVMVSFVWWRKRQKCWHPTKFSLMSIKPKIAESVAVQVFKSPFLQITFPWAHFAWTRTTILFESQTIKHMTFSLFFIWRISNNQIIFYISSVIFLEGYTSFVSKTFQAGFYGSEWVVINLGSLGDVSL